MGFYSNKGIAKVTEPRELTLSGNPNFIVFESVRRGVPDRKMTVKITFNQLANHETGLKFVFKEEKTAFEHSFYSTNKPNEVNNTTFLLVSDYGSIPGRSDATSTAQNLLICMRKDSFLCNNFDMYIEPDISEDGIIKNGSTIVIMAKGYGVQYNLDCSIAYKQDYVNDGSNPEYVYDDIDLQLISKGSSSDSIDQGIGDTRIELDIYDNTDSGFGEYKETICHAGTYLTSLSKSYFGQPLWFELNALMNKRVGYSSLFLDTENKWIDAGTVSSYRLIARKLSNSNNEVFYYSNPLYVLNGYAALLSDTDMQSIDEDNSCYVLDFEQDFLAEEIIKVKPLTSRLDRTHIKGQKQYINFIANNFSKESLDSGLFSSFCLYYRLYTQSDEFITDYVSHQINIGLLNTINTAQLNLDRLLPSVNIGGKDRTVGKIEVFLSVKSKDESLNEDLSRFSVSIPLTFRVLPEYLYPVNDFAFLNSLGGWDSVNFSGVVSTEFKTTPTTIFKTLKPEVIQSSSIESVVSKNIEEQIIVQSTPLDYNSVEWLQQMSASPAVYELKSKRYIIIDDMILKYNLKDDLFQIEMKYHYTDSIR